MNSTKTLGVIALFLILVGCAANHYTTSTPTPLVVTKATANPLEASGDHGHSGRSRSKGGSAPGDSPEVIQHETKEIYAVLQGINHDAGIFQVGFDGISNHGTRLNIKMSPALGLSPSNPQNQMYSELSSRLGSAWTDIWMRHHPNDPRAKAYAQNPLGDNTDPTQLFLYNHKLGPDAYD